MRLTAIILLITMALLSCNAQKPDIQAHSQQQMDSVKLVLSNTTFERDSFKTSDYSKTLIINRQNKEIDSLNAISKNYTGKTIFLTDTAKTIVFSSHQLGYVNNSFELFFGDKDYVYRLINQTDLIKIEKRYRNDSLSIKLSIPLND